MSKDQAYINAQSALIACDARNTPPNAAQAAAVVSPFKSFDDILGNYTVSVQSKLRAHCNTELTTSFNALHSASKTELKKLKAGSLEYARFLNTQHGKLFERDVSHPAIVELYASMNGNASSGGPSGLNAPVQPTVVLKKEGFNCLTPDSLSPTKVADKIEVLNCLAFDTPSTFWEDQSEKNETTHFIATNTRYEFLGDGDWKCSRSPVFMTLRQFHGEMTELTSYAIMYNPPIKTKKDFLGFTLDYFCVSVVDNVSTIFYAGHQPGFCSVVGGKK